MNYFLKVCDSITQFRPYCNIVRQFNVQQPGFHRAEAEILLCNFALYEMTQSAEHGFTVEMTPSENELIIESSLHSRGISIHLEGPVGGKSCSKTPGSMCVNKSCLIQPGASSSIHTNIPNVCAPSSCHGSIVPSPECPCLSSLLYNYTNLEAFIVLIGH